MTETIPTKNRSARLRPDPPGSKRRVGTCRNAQALGVMAETIPIKNRQRADELRCGTGRPWSVLRPAPMKAEYRRLLN